MAEDNSMFDKMIEMGMGMSIASQIPRMMNTAMGGTQQSASQTPPPLAAAASLQLYASINNAQAGPFTEPEFITLIQKGLVNANTLVWKPGLSGWVPANQVPEVGKMLLLYSSDTH